ncbi:isochorismatase family protein [Streptomyces sp. NPDC048295]|uniref:isochorismatase family protein n=1 Tax=Streptomyces sp. NPDC048295 TaxID=3154617 RepID=UPI00344377E5
MPTAPPHHTWHDASVFCAGGGRADQVLAEAGGTAHDATRIHDQVAPQDGGIVVREIRHGAASTAELHEQPADRGIGTPALVGISAGGVVLSILMDVADRNCGVCVLSGGVTDRDPGIHRTLIDKTFPARAHIIGMPGCAPCCGRPRNRPGRRAAEDLAHLDNSLGATAWRQVVSSGTRWCHLVPCDAIRWLARWVSAEGATVERFDCFFIFAGQGGLCRVCTTCGAMQACVRCHIGAMMTPWTSPRMSTPSAANSRWPPKPAGKVLVSWPSGSPLRWSRRPV